MKRVTVYDIAKEAKVSVTTVSRVLNGTAPVKHSTRKKITELIEKYQFQPNALARSLTKKETKMIGIILPDITNPFFPEVFTGVENALAEAGYTFFLCTTGGNDERESAYLGLLREKQVDGIIFMGGRINSVECPPVLAEEVVNLSKHIPIVLVNGTLPGNPLPRVKTDEYVGAEMVTEHLIELGHRKIGFIGGMEETTTTVEKVAAFESTLKKHGISPRKDWIRYGDFSVACGRKLMSGLLKERDRPTAVFCVNDFTSVGAIKAAIEAGLSIPDDVAIVGFDDTPLASSIIPELTTVSQESNRLGVTAFHVLQRLINGEQVEELSVIQPRLLVRESTVKK